MSGAQRFKASPPKKTVKTSEKNKTKEDLDIRVNRQLLQEFLKKKSRKKSKP